MLTNAISMLCLKFAGIFVENYQLCLLFFRISFDDFLYNFDEVQFSHLQPDVIGHDLSKTLVFIMFFQIQNECSVSCCLRYDYYCLNAFMLHKKINN